MKIIHTVLFNLKHKKDSVESDLFFKDSFSILSPIQQAHDFTMFDQVSQKNNFNYAFSMFFDSRADYDEYNQNESHKNYVQSRWLNEVSEFMEIDLEEK